MQSILYVEKLLSKRTRLVRESRTCTLQELGKIQSELNQVNQELMRIGSLKII